ncbi:c-type cytochrome [Bradyrhizobium rifense]|uniref:C-type cytochrome n=1 Tax=Bradyrhizobium rifense TaxID=515499 RepID=A0A5D3KUE8_9BRAD|nr:cytochrome c [Bradyrhizobium rifense]TYL96356.1 c-type cytochrome [Bradyrhizobium rifense]
MSRAGHRICALLILFAGSLMAGASSAAEQIDPPADKATIERGAYLAIAADCAACHTAPGGKPFAGGLPIGTPLGTIYSTNITPSAEFGIGRYTADEFARALRRGIRRDGAQLYPAMPYTSYAKFTDDDARALYAYFTKGVQPVDVRAPVTALPFPMNIRLSMMVWNFLFLDSNVYAPDPRQSAEWNRGAYLAQGAAHCGTCHTPRGFLMQEEASRALSGAQVGPWYAPNITSDPATGIGSWTREELAAFLRTGRLPGKAQAAGSMGEAVEHSFQHLSAADLDAVATYVKSVPPVQDAASGSRFSAGRMFSELSVLRGRNPISSNNDANPTGAQLFQGNCASCHSAEGQGSKDGYYPSLFHNSATGEKNPANLIAAILYGVDRTVSGRQAFMPGFGGHPTDSNQLSNRDIAMLGTYVLTHYGAGDTTITEQQVSEARHGGPSSPLLPLARGGLAAGAVVLVLGVAFLIFRRRKAVVQKA